MFRVSTGTLQPDVTYWDYRATILFHQGGLEAHNTPKAVGELTVLEGCVFGRKAQMNLLPGFEDAPAAS